ncbi:helix-turn-helix transcriptional regulator [Candidatus Saccharibacteria bacterium]|nr:helix-turn-helix transcriptional regulator [Candidatus Saccharibacteria bacterium]
MTFKENLAELRKLNKLSQERLATKVGVSRQSVSKWETGEAYPEMANILALCSIFHCKITDLIDTGSPEMKKFDADTEKGIVELEKKDQKRFGAVSKTIFIIARIVRIISLSTFVVIPVVAYILHWAIWNWLVMGFPAEAGIEDLTVGNFIKYGAAPKALVVVLIFALMIVAAVYVYKMLLEVERFFKRLYAEPTPFTTENVFGLKKIAKFSIVWLVSQNLAKFIMALLIPATGMTFNIASVIYSLIVVAMVYVFRYGYLMEVKYRR